MNDKHAADIFRKTVGQRQALYEGYGETLITEAWILNVIWEFWDLLSLWQILSISEWQATKAYGG